MGKPSGQCELVGFDTYFNINQQQDTQNLRDLVILEAREWLETPFHHAASVKGRQGGVDCLMLLAEVYSRVGIITKPEVPYYPSDWHMHRSIERYLEGVIGYAREVEEPVRGGVALYKFGRCFSHGVIITEWPEFIHSYWLGKKVMRGRGDMHPFCDQDRQVRFFDPISWE